MGDPKLSSLTTDATVTRTWVTVGKELSAQKKAYRLSGAEAGTKKKNLKSLSLLVTLCPDDDLAQDLL